MQFKKATDALFKQISHADLARALNVSVALVRQARLQPSASAHRSAPEGWENAVICLAEEQGARHLRLAKRLGRER